MTPRMPWMSRGGLAARDLRPEDVDDHMIHGPTARLVSPPQAGLFMGGPRMGHPMLEHPMMDDPRELLNEHFGDEDEPEFDSSSWSDNPRLPEAIALAEDDQPMAALRLALQGDDLDERTLEFTCDVLMELLDAEQLEEGGYEPIAALLSLSHQPGETVRATAALALLALEGPDGVELARATLFANGQTLAQAVNEVRERAGLQPLSWDTSGEAEIDPGADDEDADVEPDA